jgi:hypothetical protein
VVEMMRQMPEMFEWNETFITFLEVSFPFPLLTLTLPLTLTLQENIYFPSKKSILGGRHFPVTVLNEIQRHLAHFSNPVYSGSVRTPAREKLTKPR